MNFEGKAMVGTVDCIMKGMENYELMVATCPHFNFSSGFHLHLESEGGSAGSVSLHLTKHLSGLTPPCSGNPGDP